MNRQYLKSLQQRAQRLLQISSDEQQPQQQNFNLTKARSRRVDLNEVLSNTDVNQINAQFQDYRNTDVQLLKRCINLTNQNTELKRLLKSHQTEKSQLKAQNTFLEKQLENYKIQLARIKQRSSQKPNGSSQALTMSPFHKLKQQQNDHFSFIDHNPTQSLKQKSQSVHRFASSKYTQPNEQSTNFSKAKQMQKVQQLYLRQIQQLQQRLKVANQKKEKLQATLLKEKQKAQKLWGFINRQIPQLRDVVNGLVNKVDVHVENVLLKDVNQEERKLIKRKQQNYNKSSRNY